MRAAVTTSVALIALVFAGGACRGGAPSAAPTGCDEVARLADHCGPAGGATFHERFGRAREVLARLGPGAGTCVRTLLARTDADETLSQALAAAHLAHVPADAEAWANDLDPHVRGGAALAASRTRVPVEHLALVLRVSRDPSPEARAAAVTALRVLVDRPAAAVARVMELLGDPAANVRAAAAAAAGVLLTPAQGASVAVLLDDADEDVQVRAAFALKALGYMGATARLRALAEHGAPRARLAAARSLAALAGARAGGVDAAPDGGP